ncbi:MAG: molecular chaperone HtpG [Hyphomicrobiaceae bacterium]
MTSNNATESPTQPFEAEVAELLRLMVHSVYSETEIFLRELISNASDACDKLRYEAIAAPELLDEASPLVIRITANKDVGTLTVTDTGIGMSRDELAENLGTIARSGTKAFVSQLADANDGASLIGQFGVGFYSAFMVADRIVVTSRRAGAGEAWVWQSTGTAGYDIRPAEPEDNERVPRGTEIVLHLKDDAKDYLEQHALERIVRLYSDHILFPIELADDAGEWRQVNSASALWQRSKSELKPEDYQESYRTIAHAFDEPAVILHYKAEGRQSYAVLLFVPSQPPFDLFDQARKGRVKLYVRRVFITDEAELLPAYLRFVRGVVDSEDLPLNMSREMLQKNPHVTAIRNALTGRILSELDRLAEREPETFAQVWTAFGAVLKEGIYEDHERRERLLALARFASTTGDEPRALKQYVEDLKPNQTEIYYLIGDSVAQLQSNPNLEAARARGIEVLLLTDHVDAFWTTLQLDFDGKPLKSLSQGDVNFDLVPLIEQPAEKDDASTSTIDQAVVIAEIKGVLEDMVSDVRASQRLIDSPSCLIAGEAGPDRRLERLLAHTQTASLNKPILELNMKHPLVTAIANAKTGGNEADVSDLAHLLFEQAQILDGAIPDDPAAFTQRLNRLIARGLTSS